MHATLENFEEYLEFRKLVPLRAIKTLAGFEAEVRILDHPKAEHYSNVFPCSRYTMIVRVSKSDWNNDEMTDGFLSKSDLKSEGRTKIHLCADCANTYPECDSRPIFGDGIGNDNVYKCDSFIN